MVNIKNTKTTKKRTSKLSKSSSAKLTKTQSKIKTAKIKIEKTPADAIKRKSLVDSRGNSNKKKQPANYNSIRGKKIQEIKLKLICQKDLLLNEAEVALNELPGQTVFPDLGDQASAETDRNFMLRLRGREQRLLKKIEEAIERIDNGSFGICEDCGEEIDIKRLEARPVTTMCIECKTLQEEEEKLRES